MFEPKLIKGGKDKPLLESPDFKKEIINDSKIEEEKVFSKGEILGLIEQIAKKENIKPDQLEIVEEVYDEKGNLITLNVEVKKEKALGEGWKSIKYDYVIKGKHGDHAHSEASVICRLYNIKDSDAAQGGIVAEYKNGSWELTPGKISMRGVDVKSTDSK